MARKKGLPMTRLVNQLIEKGLKDEEEAEKRNHRQGAAKVFKKQKGSSFLRTQAPAAQFLKSNGNHAGRQSGMF
jgi:hypothetical protein